MARIARRKRREKSRPRGDVGHYRSDPKLRLSVEAVSHASAPNVTVCKTSSYLHKDLCGLPATVSSSSGQSATHLAWRTSNERRRTKSSHQSLPQLPEATMEVRSVAAELPKMLFIGCGMSGLWEVVQVEQWGCKSRKDDGKVLRRTRG